MDKKLLKKVVKELRQDREFLRKYAAENNYDMYERQLDDIIIKINFLRDLELINLSQYVRLGYIILEW